ncbi:MAG: hydrogenase maturation protease [Gammaproteobacteria bacterium]|nr:hydrogenase maturation protease [Gammaproteobacteria bacterium]MBU0787324.1 hydrogenase maturation protease [Gammaproteobacteria bacterium]MBU0816064.1 hydrogenase maturation protease [Gammaproteobacteria bacterium]MBU1787603.1 hydrogenase maturation protease [Gammaproteobacteria bacterium]
MTLPTKSVAPILVFGWGNPSRGDDALGPLFIERLSAALDDEQASSVEFLTDFQLQVEHALDLVGRSRVLFVDASMRGAAPFQVSTLQPACDPSFTTHAMSPEAVMHVFHQLKGRTPPPCTLLAIRGDCFELGEPPSEAALSNLTQAIAWSQRWLIADQPMTVLHELHHA